MDFNLSTKPDDLSMKLRAHGRPIKEETEKLEQESNQMSDRLKELKLIMSREREEREKKQQQYWKSGNVGSLYSASSDRRTTSGHPGDHPRGTRQNSSKDQPQQKNKYKIKVLKDDPISKYTTVVAKSLESLEGCHQPSNATHIVPDRAPLPGTLSHIAHRDLSKTRNTGAKAGSNSAGNSKLKENKCGQCENRVAQVSCIECGEEYCARCFALFHIKGALKKHRSVPIGSSGLRTPRSAVAPVRFLGDMNGKESEKHSEQKKNNQTSKVGGGDGLMVGGEGCGGGLLLNGSYKEDESALSFQEALKGWRQGSNPPNKNNIDIGIGVGDQSLPPTSRSPPHATNIEIKFNTPGLSYAEKLLLKKHRREQQATGSNSTSAVNTSRTISDTRSSNSTTPTLKDEGSENGITPRPSPQYERNVTQLSKELVKDSIDSALKIFHSDESAQNDLAELLGCNNQKDNKADDDVNDDERTESRLSIVEINETNAPGLVGQSFEKSSQYVVEEVQDSMDSGRIFTKSSKFDLIKSDANGNVDIIESNDRRKENMIRDKKSNDFENNNISNNKKSSGMNNNRNSKEKLQSSGAKNTSNYNVRGSTENLSSKDKIDKKVNIQKRSVVGSSEDVSDNGRGWKKEAGVQKNVKSIDCRTVADIMDRRPRSKYADSSESIGTEPTANITEGASSPSSSRKGSKESVATSQSSIASTSKNISGNSARNVKKGSARKSSTGGFKTNTSVEQPVVDDLMLQGHKTGLRVRSSPRKRTGDSAATAENEKADDLNSLVKSFRDNSAQVTDTVSERLNLNKKSLSGGGQTSGRTSARSGIMSRPTSARKSAMYSEGELSQPVPSALREVALLSSVGVGPSEVSNLDKYFTLGLEEPAPPPPPTPTTSRSRPTSAKPKLSNKFYQIGPKSWKPDSSICTDETSMNASNEILDSKVQKSFSAGQSSTRAVNGSTSANKSLSGTVNGSVGASKDSTSTTSNSRTHSASKALSQNAELLIPPGMHDDEPDSPANTPIASARSSDDNSTPRNVFDSFQTNPPSPRLEDVNVRENMLSHTPRSSIESFSGFVGGRVTPNLMIRREPLRPRPERRLTSARSSMASSRVSSRSRGGDRPSCMIVMEGDDMSEYDERDYKLQQRLIDDELYDKIDSDVHSEAGLDHIPSTNNSQSSAKPTNTSTKEATVDKSAKITDKDGQHKSIDNDTFSADENSNTNNNSNSDAAIRLTESRLMFDFEEMESRYNVEPADFGSDDEASVRALQ